MAIAPASPSHGKPIYASPTGWNPNHQRHPSTRRSFSAVSPIPSIPKIESPRTLCPRDGDAFSYNPAHLPAWYMPQDLWARLPRKLLASLAAMQHAGAAVLTGFERLENLSGSLNSVPEEKTQASGPELEDNFVTAIAKPRTASNASSLRHDSGFSSPISASPTSSISSSPLLSSHYPTASISPLSLPPTINTVAQTNLHHRRAFTTPLNPHNSYYAAELSYLRTDSLPRLRHSARESRRNGQSASAPIMPLLARQRSLRRGGLRRRNWSVAWTTRARGSACQWVSEGWAWDGGVHEC